MKKWWKSKTLWFNAIIGALTTLEANFNVLQPLIPVNAYAVLSVALTVGNAVLRIVTTQGLSK